MSPRLACARAAFILRARIFWCATISSGSLVEHISERERKIPGSPAISSLAADSAAVEFVIADSVLVNPDRQWRKSERYQTLQLRSAAPIESEL